MKRFGQNLLGMIVGIFRLCGCLAVGCGFSACSDRQHASSTVTVPIRYSLSFDPFSLDPRIGGGALPQGIIKKLFEGLMRTDTQGVPQLGLAKSIVSSEDKKTYTFTLRPSKWSNGSPVTADDFAYAWKSIISRTIQTRHAGVFFCIKNAKKAFTNDCSIDQVGIRVLDDLTLQVELEHPAPYFLEWVANPLFSPICHSCFKDKTTMDTVEGSNYVCNGPYMLTKRIIGQQIDLEENPKYWNPVAEKKGPLQFLVIPDPTTAYNLFCNGELDYVGEPLTTVSIEIAEAFIRQHKHGFSKKNFLDWLVCNVHLKHLSSTKIRKALACAINRSELASKLFQNRSFPSYSVVHSKESLLESSTFDDNTITMARKLFSEGLSELGYTEKTFPILTLSCRAESESIATCELIVQQLHSALGIDVQLQILEPIRLVNNLTENRFELCEFHWTSYINDPIYNLESLDATTGGFFKNGWSNQTYADLLKASNNETDLIKRKELMKAAEKLIMDELPYIPILEKPCFFAKQDNISEDFEI